MKTPICDFVKRYTESNVTRLHMPGHKGSGPLGFEESDITEILGADDLYTADGIIRESEENASLLFGCPTFYSTEGSSQCIRAMLLLARLHALAQGKTPHILAARNVHKTFLSAVALLDAEVSWIPTQEEDSYLSCTVCAAHLESLLKDAQPLPTALYLTAPDYLGKTADIAAIAAVCHRYGLLLLVDNAHGAYLRFLSPSSHPMDLGADICCDSAHKTLPVLTGGAYLHLSPRLQDALAANVKDSLALFGSTSPSYLILQSLDAANALLERDFPASLAAFLPTVQRLRTQLEAHGYPLFSDEPLKLTVLAKPYGYTGTALADRLRESGFECEFADPDLLVLMFSPMQEEAILERLLACLCSIPRREAITDMPPPPAQHRKRTSIRQALLSPAEERPVEECLGRILATPSVACPPAVPILLCGEEIDGSAIAAFRYYGIQTCTVLQATASAE